ncbi:MAG: hypothetical protein KDI44_08590 [Thiothrix sp.]|nr:hypothetical protein [Thiothrix sp.]HPQ96018.1 sarcosine oxidase subunit gamma family protein [Thiolinea sp.]
MANVEPVFETALAHVDTSAMSEPDFNVTEVRDFACVLLRIHPQTAGAGAALARLGLAFPPALGIHAIPQQRLLMKWISPDEYLVTLPVTDKAAFIEQAETAFAGLFAAVVDNTGGYSLLRIGGGQRYAVLSKLCFYDLKGNLPVGKVVSTALAKAPAIFYRVQEDELYCLLRGSFADYGWKILLTASAEFL